MTRKPILLNIFFALALVALLGVAAGAAEKPRPAQPVADDAAASALPEGSRDIQKAPNAPAATLTVPGDYATIQAAIDAAVSGDIITVAAGTYAEAIIIDGKNLTITGAGAGSSIITGTAGQTQYIVRITNGAVVDFSGFTVDGTGIDREYGIFADAGSDGDIHDNVVMNVSWPGALGIAIRRQECYIDVTSNDVYGFGRIGIYTRDDVIGNTDTGVISGNTVTGLGGLDPDRLSYGISVYSGNPTIDGNDIYACVSGANVASWLSCGLDIWTGATSAITNNNFYDSEYGIVSNSASPTMSGNTFTNITEDNVRLDYFVKGNPTPHWAEYYDGIQEAIDAIPVTTYPCVVWIGIYSGGGTYAEALNVNKPCHIWGYSRAGVLLDVEGYAVNNAGVYIAADDVLISGFTLESNSATSLPRYGVKFGDFDGCYLDDAEIRYCYRSGMDALGATNLSVSDVEVHDNGGNGLQLCDCSNVTFDGITTYNNSWGGIGIFTYGQWTPIGVSGVVFTGTNSLGETSPVANIYLEEGNYSDPGNPQPITYSTNPADGADVTLQLSDVTHMLTGNSDNSNNYNVFYSSLADAQTAASGPAGHVTDGRYIVELAGTNLYVPAYQGGIQPAVDAADPNDTVHIEAGTFVEQVEIAKDLVIQGAGASTVIESPATLPLFFTTSLDNYPIVYIHDAADVELHDLTVDGAGNGSANYRFYGVAYRNAGGGVYDCSILNVADTPFSGAQHGVAMYVYNDDLTSRSVDVHGCTFTGFQKNAMALNAGATTPLAVDVRGNTITGAGPTSVTAQNGVQVWGDLATGEVDDNVITGVGYTGSGWVGSSILNYYGALDIEDNTITVAHMGIYNYDGEGLIAGNDVEVELMGDYCYGIIASDPPTAKPSPFAEEETPLESGRDILKAPLALLDVDIIGNTVTNVGATVAGTYGIECDAGWGPDDLDLTITHNTVCNFEAAIEVYACQTDCDTGVFTSVVANYNYIGCGNTYGIRSNADYLVVDGTNNWWGDASGPYHATLNPAGTGDEVSDYVDFDPWMGAPSVLRPLPDPMWSQCSPAMPLIFEFSHVGPGEVRGIDVTFTLDNTVVSATTADFAEGNFLSDFGSTTFYPQDVGGGEYKVSTSILGGTTGATGTANLFYLNFSTVAEGISAVTITDLKVRDVDNAPLDASAVDGEIRVDCTPPTMEPIVEPEGVCYNTAPTFSNFGFDDNYALYHAFYQIDGGAGGDLFTEINVPEWNDDGWTLPGFAGLSEGAHTITFVVMDNAANMNGFGTPDTYSWSFIKDTVPPAPPTGFTAMPGHDKVHLAWTDPAGDPSFVGVEIRLVAWGDYPQYLSAPSYPADNTEGTFVTQVAGGTGLYDDDPRTPRDIYYYAAFSYDCAGNYSAFDAGAADRSTSYWLGDFYAGYDGYVNFNDLGDFSNAFGTVEGGGGWNAEADFGPTDDWSRFGIPLPDDAIDFEDLMIFSMNYGNVDPSGFDFVPEERTPENLENMIAFELVPGTGEEGTVISVVMNNRAATLKGAELLIETGAGTEIVNISRGDDFSGRGDVFFGTIDSHEGTRICLAALGVDKAITGSGEIARILVRGDGAINVSIGGADIRDTENRQFVLEGTGSYDGPAIPDADALSQNFPNPFNPATTIAFDLSKPADVSIGVYDVSGRLVRTLVDGKMAAGSHEVVWNGTSNAGTGVPSGMYFYRMITSEGFTATRKMILLR